jgi:hypothetical protein
MPYETDPAVLGWFVRNLADGRPAVRRRAIELLEYVTCERREQWLVAASSDADPQVVATAVVIAAIVATQSDEGTLELLESDAFDGLAGEDLDWEWEYVVKVCRGPWVPPTGVVVWTRDEDDVAAKQLAVMKMTAGQPSAEEVVPVIVAKRSVTRYTRSARSVVEARKWHARGRPRYDAGESG